MSPQNLSTVARSRPLFLRRSSMLSTLAGGGVSARGAAEPAAPAVAYAYDYAAASAPAADSLVPGVPNWALAVGGVAVAGVAILVLRSRRKRGAK